MHRKARLEDPGYATGDSGIAPRERLFANQTLLHRTEKCPLEPRRDFLITPRLSSRHFASECPPPTLPQKNCHLSFIDHLIRAVGLVLICEIRHGRRFAWHPQATKAPRQGTACHYRMVFYSLSIWSRRVHVTDGNSLVCKRRHVKCDEVSSRPVGSPKKVTDPNVPGSPTMWALRQGPTPMRLWWQRYCITTD